MGKVFGWILSFTKVGKVVDPAQKFLSGKKVYIAGAGLAIPAILTMIQGFSDNGVGYLATVAGTPEWAHLLEGIGAMGLRAAVTKGFNPPKDPNYPNQDK